MTTRLPPSIIVFISISLLNSNQVVAESGKNTVIASSFADPADIVAFKRCKNRGGSDKKCFEVGDNGVGLWGDDTSDESKAMCALPRGVWQDKWGRGDLARGKKLAVTYKGKTIVCELRDTLPARPKNGAGLDLSPGAAKAFGVAPPFMLRNVIWRWDE